MNRSMVQPQDPPSVPSQPTCSWKSLKSKPSNQPKHPSLWVRFVDDTLVIQEADHSQQFLQYINSQDPNIQFAVEEPGTDGSIPFLDTKVKPGLNNTIHTTVYRKPSHTDQYLHWDSNHFITAKNIVYNTLALRAKVVSSTPEDLNKEMEHLNKALREYHFPNWTLNRLQLQFQQKHLNNNTQGEATTNNNNQDTNQGQKNKNIFMVVPYIKGIGERFNEICNKKGIQVHFKGTNTVK